MLVEHDLITTPRLDPHQAGSGQSMQPLVAIRASARFGYPAEPARSRMVTGPAPPSPTRQDPSRDFTVPTGVTTAAVPQANTSVISPEAQPARHSSTLIDPPRP